MKPIYLDYMSTTPVDPHVAAAMAGCLTLEGDFGNPASSTHAYGFQARERVDRARLQVAQLINAAPREIIWTSGATESDNLAIKGVAEFHARSGRHIITMSTEHKAVLDSCDALESAGYRVTRLNPKPDGLLDLAALNNALCDDTILISVMHVNNETGVIQDIQAIGELARSHGVLFHVDAAQSVGKIPVDVSALPVDLMSLASHKLYGPKGIGALYVAREPRVRLAAQMHGGGHEWGLRSGTLPTHQIVGMGEAYAMARDRLRLENERISEQTKRLWKGLQVLSDIRLNGHASLRVPGNLNISFAGVDGEALMLRLTRLAVSNGSACNSANLQPSYVLKALGLSDAMADASLRLCVGRYTSDDDIDIAIADIVAAVTALRAIAP